MALEVLNVDMALKVLSLCAHVDSLIVFLLVFTFQCSGFDDRSYSLGVWIVVNVDQDMKVCVEFWFALQIRLCLSLVVGCVHKKNQSILNVLCHGYEMVDMLILLKSCVNKSSKI